MTGAALLMSVALAADPSPLEQAAALLGELLEPTVCWQSDGDGVVLGMQSADGPVYPVDGTRAPTVAEAVAALPDGHPAAATDPDDVSECVVVWAGP